MKYLKEFRNNESGEDVIIPCTKCGSYDTKYIGNKDDRKYECNSCEITFNILKENLITEDGDGGGGAPAAGSGDGGGGVAYTSQANVSGMGSVSNATVSPVPGDPSFSEPGSGDRSFTLGESPKKKKKDVEIKNTDTIKKVEDESITGTVYQKMASNNKKFLQDAKKVKDNLGIGKVMSFQSFLNN